MKVCVVGATGAFGRKHLEAIQNIDDVTVSVMVSPEQDKLDALISEYDSQAVGVTTLEEALVRDDVDAVILATPTQVHASQAIQCMEAGKHVLVEIPMADNIEDSYKVVETQKATGLVAMAGHTRRFNPSHQ